VYGSAVSNIVCAHLEPITCSAITIIEAVLFPRPALDGGSGRSRTSRVGNRARFMIQSLVQKDVPSLLLGLVVITMDHLRTIAANIRQSDYVEAGF